MEARLSELDKGGAGSIRAFIKAIQEYEKKIGEFEQKIEELRSIAYDKSQRFPSHAGRSTALGFVAMSLGLLLLNAGLLRAKNTVSFLLANTLAIAICSMIVCSFSLSPELIGNTGLSSVVFLGIVAERIKIWASLFVVTVSVIVAVFILSPLSGTEFGQSTGVMTPAFLLIGLGIGVFAAVLLGPRKGKYAANGSSRAIPGSNMPLVVVGLSVYLIGELSLFSQDGWIVSVMFSWGSAYIVSSLTTRLMFGRVDFTVMINSGLSGSSLVFVFAADGSMHTLMLSSAACGVAVPIVISFLDKVRIDDPTGHLAGFGSALFVSLLLTFIFDTYWSSGPGVGFAGIVVTAGVISLLIARLVVGIRVSDEQEYEGSDHTYAGYQAYPEFVKSRNS